MPSLSAKLVSYLTSIARHGNVLLLTSAILTWRVAVSAMMLGWWSLSR